ncbi:rhamnogalacturonidase [Sphingomonas sp. CFBP 13720]|uniref:rhamnogalacturonidase n=1 Tax=Sphingomonas sp. CFBP 13720 TaxID=2775302 RepID=UPI00177F8E9A|nr:right-handed parallel beta-helix repeat-containing protein [Sphingomonas sp. CFBP 13720]
MGRRSVVAALLLLPFPAHAARRFDVRTFGARGDDRTIDTQAIQQAIDHAGHGGGIVIVPRGRYRCFTLRLVSNVTLVLEEGATIVAADPATDGGRYALPEDRGEQLYQDFGHSHWHNSLIVGDGVRRVAILGPGGIDGAGLTRDGPGARWRKQAGERPLSMRQMTAAEIAALEPDAARMNGLGNKAIALVDARDVRIEGLSIRKGGHFAILATGCSDLTLRNLTIDTDRDGIDLDCVSRVLVEGCRVNSPNDDAIVVKSSFALGRVIASEDVTIRDCDVSGFDLGTMIDGTRRRTQQIAPDRDRVTGRIKLGTESNGGYRRIRIERCRFTRSRGVALETVDGGVMEDVIVRDVTMDEVTTAPLFLRIGDRRRGPAGTGTGTIRGVVIEGLRASGIDPRFAATLAGLPGHPIEDVTLRDIRLTYLGGGAAVKVDPPELADAYPEPSMFGPTPAWGLWCRHVRGLRIDGLHLASPGDARPATKFDDVTDAKVTKLTGNV